MQISKYFFKVGDQLTFWCPGCRDDHAISVGPGGWTWNNDPVNAVIMASIKTEHVAVINDADGKWTGEWQYDGDGNPIKVLCHSYIGSMGAPPGHIMFLGDSTHHLAGKTVPLAELPKHYQTAYVYAEVGTEDAST